MAILSEYGGFRSKVVGAMAALSHSVLNMASISGFVKYRQAPQLLAFIRMTLWTGSSMVGSTIGGASIKVGTCVVYLPARPSIAS